MSDGADASALDAGAGLDEVDRARSNEYALLAALLLRAPDEDFLARLSLLQGDSTALGHAHAALGRAASSIGADAVRREYFELFIGVGRGLLLPYASYYLTGFLNDRPLADLRGEMKRLRLERAEGHGEPEDHLGTLFEIMSGFADRRFAVSFDEERGFFTRHVAPWAPRFFADLEEVEAAGFYRAVGTVGRIFLDIEAEGFAMAVKEGA